MKKKKIIFVCLFFLYFNGIGATNRTCREIQCLLYAEFFGCKWMIFKNNFCSHYFRNCIVIDLTISFKLIVLGLQSHVTQMPELPQHNETYELVGG